MKKLLQALGTGAFWAVFPALAVYLSRGPRTRVVIRAGNKIVVVKGWLGNGKWVLPGGGLQKGEPPLQGLLREVREETGLKLDQAEVRPLLKAPYHYHGIHYLCHYFVIDLPLELPLFAELFEISELKWENVSKLTDRTANGDVLTALKRLQVHKKHA
ncbi:MAG TPA: NUDIX hydrolase [Candidatus Saccharimonadales bacterium]|nr:NUDIX hydrolase [Candidatus Saccharimonadales bacterium]